MIGKNIKFQNFKKVKNFKKVRRDLKDLLQEKSQLIESLKSSYKNNYNFKKILKIKKNLDIRIIGIGGSILGAKAIHDSLFKSVKRKISFIEGLESKKFNNKKKYFNFVNANQYNLLFPLMISFVIL